MPVGSAEAGAPADRDAPARSNSAIRRRSCESRSRQRCSLTDAYRSEREKARHCAGSGADARRVWRAVRGHRASTGADPGDCASNLSEDGDHACRMSAARAAATRRPSGRKCWLSRFARIASPAHEQTMPNRAVKSYGRTAEARADWSHRYLRVAGWLAVHVAERAPIAITKRPPVEPEAQASGGAGPGPVVWAVRSARASASIPCGRRTGGRPSRILLPSRRHQLRDHASFMGAAGPSDRHAQTPGGLSINK